MPAAASFGNVLTEARKKQAMVTGTISVLQKLYDMANNHFRHGTPFVLKAEPKSGAGWAIVIRAAREDRANSDISRSG
jgi:hypothetical protein